MQDGSRQSIVTEPGSIVLYESAKIIHGRPKVYKGTYYYACFVHYRPRNFGESTLVDYAEQANRNIQKNMHLCGKFQHAAWYKDPSRGLPALLLGVTAALAIGGKSFKLY